VIIGIFMLVGEFCNSVIDKLQKKMPNAPMWY